MVSAVSRDASSSQLGTSHLHSTPLPHPEASPYSRMPPSSAWTGPEGMGRLVLSESLSGPTAQCNPRPHLSDSSLTTDEILYNSFGDVFSSFGLMHGKVCIRMFHWHLQKRSVLCFQHTVFII